MLEKTYNPSLIERKWYEASEEADAFVCAPDDATTPYTIMTVSYTHLTLPTILLV